MSYKDKEFISGKELREILSISNSTLARWIKTGKIKVIRLNEHKNSPVRIPTSEIERLLNENQEEQEEKE